MKTALSTFLFLSAALITACSSQPTQPEAQQPTDQAAAAPAEPKLVKQDMLYRAGKTEMKGYVVYPEGGEKRPAVLIVHEWWGLNDYIRGRAEDVARLGYVAVALDMYGQGKTADHPKLAGELAKGVMSNMKEASKRFQAGIDLAKSLPMVNPDKIAAMGYCFGGGVVLAMAKSGADLDSVVSFHGSMPGGPAPKKGSVKSKILVLNGAADPMVKPADIDRFVSQVKKAGGDIEVVNYEGALHAFTNPKATEVGKQYNLPIAYDAQADKMSWERFKETLSQTL